MEELWISVLVILVAFALFFPEDIVIFWEYIQILVATLEVEIKRRWMMAWIWPRLQYDRIRIERRARKRQREYNSKANHQTNNTND